MLVFARRSVLQPSLPSLFKGLDSSLPLLLLQRKDGFTNPVRRWRTTGGSSSATAGATSEILMEHHNHATDSNSWVTTLTLNRPKANAMGSQMLQELCDCLSELENPLDNNNNNNKIDEGDDSENPPISRCVVLTSYSTKVFSAGADLKERATMAQDEAAEFVTKLRNTMERLSTLPIPVIASVEGVAVGGGAEIAMAADIIVSGKKATFGLPETSLAIIPGAGGTQRLPRLIGESRAKELIWTGRRINATEAHSYGLVQTLVEEGQAFDNAMEMAWNIAQNGPIAIRASKIAIEEGLTAQNMKDALEIERLNYAKVLPTTDRLEGLAAFKDGRTPAYKGE